MPRRRAAAGVEKVVLIFALNDRRGIVNHDGDLAELLEAEGGGRINRQRREIAAATTLSGRDGGAGLGGLRLSGWWRDRLWLGGRDLRRWM